MTLGNVYDMDLKKNEVLIKEVIIQAQGEVCPSTGEVWIAALIPSYRWRWKNISRRSRKPGRAIPWTSSITRISAGSSGVLLRWFTDHSKFTFCRGWDDLFNKCSENLNSLVAMKMSPYYKGQYPPAHVSFSDVRSPTVFEEDVCPYEPTPSSSLTAF